MFWIKTVKNFLGSFIVNRGKNNKVILVDSDGLEHIVRRLKKCRIKFKGDNNTIKIYKPLGDLSLNVVVYNNTNITLKPSEFQREIKITGYDNQNNNIIIGKNCSTSATLSVLLLRGNGNITIGDDCMIAWNDEIRLGDGHDIYDKQGKIINNNQDIFIGNHVWIGADVLILKGAHIPNNSVVGVRSVVTKAFNDDNIALAGTPAKVIKTGINWTRKSQY